MAMIIMVPDLKMIRRKTFHRAVIVVQMEVVMTASTTMTTYWTKTMNGIS